MGEGGDALQSGLEKMKTKPLFLGLATLAGVAGVWFGWSASRTRSHTVTPSSHVADGTEPPNGATASPPPLRPPNPNGRFEKLSPEERVRLARKGPVGG